MQKSIKRIALAGSGNVAWYLAKGLKLQGYAITGIWSREYSHALILADSIGTVACKNPESLGKGADLIIIAVTDQAIVKVAQKIGDFEGVVIHTAGSVKMDVLAENFKRFGVLYPLQTITKENHLVTAEVPFLVEASAVEVLQAVKEVAYKLSPKVYETDSNDRLLLHVAAVFAGNYSNLMYTIGNEILKNSNLPPEILHSLILETARKAVNADPLKMQTGPARRNDSLTIQKHIESLASLPEYAHLYSLLASMISKKYI